MFDLTVKNGDTTTDTFTYGNTITIEGNVKGTEDSANALNLEQNTAQLYCGETPLSEAVNVADGSFTLTYDTSEKGIPIGSQTLTVKYGGSGIFNESSGTVGITLSKKPVTAQVASERITKQYNGEPDVEVDLNFAAGELVGEDEVTVTAPNAKFSDPYVGNDKEITLGDLEVGGKDAGWYEVSAPENVTGTIIMASTRLNVSVNQDGKFVYGDKIVVTFTPEAEYVPIPSNRSLSVDADNAVLYFEDEDDNEVVLARTTGGEDDVFTLAYDTGEKQLPCDDEPFMLYIKYGGSSNLQGAEGYAQITLERAPLRNAPTVTGDFVYGETLMANYTKQDDEEVTYQWYRGSEEIPNATETSYKLTAEDIDKSIYMEITATDDWHKGKQQSTKQEVARAPLDEDTIQKEGNTSIELGSEGTVLTAKVEGEGISGDGEWTWKSDDVSIATVTPIISTRAIVSQSSATVKAVEVGTTTITATYKTATYIGSVSYTMTVTEKEEEPAPKPDPTPLYYNIQFENICEGVDASLSKGVVKAGNQVSVYIEVEEGYDAENLKVMCKQSLYGYWEEIEEGVQPGEYIIYNVYNDIYVKVEGVEKIEEDPTGMSDIESTKVYAQNGSLYVYTSQPQEVAIITMSGTVLKREQQEGLQSYSLPKGVYIICIGEERYKIAVR